MATNINDPLEDLIRRLSPAGKEELREFLGTSPHLVVLKRAIRDLRSSDRVRLYRMLMVAPVKKLPKEEEHLAAHLAVAEEEIAAASEEFRTAWQALGDCPKIQCSKIRHISGSVAIFFFNGTNYSCFRNIPEGIYWHTGPLSIRAHGQPLPNRVDPTELEKFVWLPL
jgi:hypothetical protein